MFIAIYRFTVRPGCEEDFRTSWLTTTHGIYQQYGSLGSRLHKTSDPSVFIGYAQWPDRESWARERPPLPGEFSAARDRMWDCLTSSETIHELEVVDDYLQSRECEE